MQSRQRREVSDYVIWNKFQRFLFLPIGTEAISLCRIGVALMVLQQLMFGIAPDLLFWFGKNGVVPFDLVTLYAWRGEARFDLLPLFSHNDALLTGYFATLLIAAICMVVGFKTRFSTAYVALGLISLHHHNPYVFNAGDNMMRILCFWLSLSPCGESFSIDRYLSRRKLGTAKEKLCVPFAQRMIQIQLATAYGCAFFAKIVGSQWHEGTAIFYATRLTDFFHNRCALFDTAAFCSIAGWTTLLIELSAFTLIWFKKFRTAVLIALLALHLSIDFIFNLPVFQFVFLAGLICFIEPNTIRVIANKVSRAWSQYRDASAHETIARKDNIDSEKAESESCDLEVVRN